MPHPTPSTGSASQQGPTPQDLLVRFVEIVKASGDGAFTPANNGKHAVRVFVKDGRGFEVILTPANDPGNLIAKATFDGKGFTCEPPLTPGFVAGVAKLPPSTFRRAPTAALSLADLEATAAAQFGSDEPKAEPPAPVTKKFAVATTKPDSAEAVAATTDTAATAALKTVIISTQVALTQSAVAAEFRKIPASPLQVVLKGELDAELSVTVVNPGKKHERYGILVKYRIFLPGKTETDHEGPPGNECVTVEEEIGLGTGEAHSDNKVFPSHFPSDPRIPKLSDSSQVLQRALEWLRAAATAIAKVPRPAATNS